MHYGFTGFCNNSCLFVGLKDKPLAVKYLSVHEYLPASAIEL